MMSVEPITPEGDIGTPGQLPGPLCNFCDTGHTPGGLSPDTCLLMRPQLPYLVMVVARQQEQQCQGQGDVGPLSNVLLRQLPLQQRARTPCEFSHSPTLSSRASTHPATTHTGTQDYPSSLGIQKETNQGVGVNHLSPANPQDSDLDQELSLTSTSVLTLAEDDLEPLTFLPLS